MADMSGGEVLARCLAQEGIRTVFGLPCPEIDAFLAACDPYGLRLVPVRHESAGAHMAEGLYKSTGQVSAVLGNPGPGSANLLAGVLAALHEGIPLVAITSQHRMELVYPSSPATFQGQDQLNLFAPAVKWGGPIFAWNRISDVTRQAFRHMWNGRPGPVHLEIPAPVLYDLHDESELHLLSPTRARAGVLPPNEPQIAQAADLLAGAARPAVVSGNGVDRANANEALIGLVERLGCPVLTSASGRATVRSDHPQYVTGFSEAGDLVRHEADVVLVVGSRVGNLDTPFDKYWGDPASQKIIQIDIDPTNVAVTRPVDLAIIADARLTLEALNVELDSRGSRREPGADMVRYRAANDQVVGHLLEHVLAWSGEGIHPLHVVNTVAAVFGGDAVYVVDGGNTSTWAATGLPPTRPRSYLGITELGMLGTGIPAALGAKLGNPDRDVVCITGDGAAGFHFMEMQSAARENLAFTTVVFAEGSWTMEEPNELARYGRTFGTDMGDIRWDVVGEGLGCAGFFVDNVDDLEPALQNAKSCGRPAVVCVRTSREANRDFPPDAFSRFFEVYLGPEQ